MTDIPSIRESIEAAFTENGVTDDENRVVMDDDASERDEHGRFKSKAQEAAATDTVIDSNTDVAKTDAKVSGEAKPDTTQVSQDAKLGEAKGADKNADPTFDAPASWRPEAKAQWDKIPLPVKAEIAKRERENVNALNEANNKLALREKESGDLERVVAPYAQDWGARGIRSSEAIAQTLARAKYAYSNPEKFIKEFAAETGVDLSFSQAQQDSQDTGLAALHQELAQLRQQVAQAPQIAQQTFAQQQQAQAVNSFADARDEAGQPKHPYFDKVSDLMVNLMPRINATEPGLTHMQKLEKAYDMACRAHPDVWQSMREDMFVKSSQDKVQKEVQVATAAKARAVSPSSGSSAAVADTRGRSLREEILSAMNSAGAI